MTKHCWLLAVSLLPWLALNTSAAVFCVDVNCTNPVPPYIDWSTAATNIQDAIDAASTGDTVLVTNGIYATGGKVMAGNLTNRVVLDKALTVTSVNGYGVTVIQGCGLTPTNGNSAVRCTWLTNGALLSGFTLRGGATRTSGDTLKLQSGGGAWCASANAVVANCLIATNAAAYYAGGAYNVVLNNSLILSNSAIYGGGVYQGTLHNCVLTRNMALYETARASTLVNCTVVSNAKDGTFNCYHTNCILYFNGGNNYVNSYGTWYCCATPMPIGGGGNISADPQFLADGFHLSKTSPCRGAGTNSVVTGVDLDGQPWANPPSIGCDEWQPQPVIIVQPTIQFPTYPAGVMLSVGVVGQDPYTCWWTCNGTAVENGSGYSSDHTTNLMVNWPNLAAGGSYQAVVSNAFGMATSSVVRLQMPVHYVAAAGTAPTPPYSSWATAATNIQDAINAAAAGDCIVVTNGLYATGGKVIAGGLTNRIALDKALWVVSVNGPAVTIIQGASDPSSGTAGPLAARCAWLANGAKLSGFTLQGGATLSSGDTTMQQSGGGILGASTDATVFNCIVANNAANNSGGGASQVTLNNCTLSGNCAGAATVAGSGGGAVNCNLNNCVVSGNSTTGSGGGVSTCTLFNCAITQNTAGFYGGGVNGGRAYNCTITGNATPNMSNAGGGGYSATFTNCVVFGNRGYSNSNGSNYYTCSFAYSCTLPLASGPGNIGADPQLLADGGHLASTSPCRGTGLSNVVTGTDIDGQAWASPPSMGCDEWWPAPVIAIQPSFLTSADPAGLALSVVEAGQGPFTCWWTRDGTLIQNGGGYGSTNITNLVLSGSSLLSGGGYQVVVSNAFGMTTSAVAQVVCHYVDAAGAAPAPPYSTWATAATNIQDAINAAQAGEVVLVTNGVYASGGKAMSGSLTNRVTLDKALLVQSVNGPGATAIEGAWDPSTCNGPLAARCAWLTNGAVLSGFTLRYGATRSTGTDVNALRGGGVWGSSNAATVFNCVIVTNSAYNSGNGAYQVTLNNCTLSGNSSISPGAAAYCFLRNSAVTRNGGGGAYMSTLVNCTLSGNSDLGGAYQSTLTNCIVQGNKSQQFGAPNYYNSTLSYCCASPLPAGAGNLSADPQLLGDAIHIASASPCRGAGTNSAVSGTDYDGQPWTSPASIGCIQWQPTPNIVVQPSPQFSGPPDTAYFGPVSVAGQDPFGYFWTKDGLPVTNGGAYSISYSTNLTLNCFSPAEAGTYYLMVSNAYGMTTSQVAQVVVHCVDAAGTGPVAPYSTWATAATNIQDAIDAASTGDCVLVTNGLYASGGRVMDGDLTNRVALNKALALMSVNGYGTTIIQGAWDPIATNGPAAVRCAWLTNGAFLSGFTLQGGATRSSGPASVLFGGGAFIPGSGTIANCVISSNAAASYGGGVYGSSSGWVHHCQILSNQAQQGGGAAYVSLYTCFLQGNSAASQGGGVYQCLTALSCTMVGNSAATQGGGAWFYNPNINARPQNLIDSIVYFNAGPANPDVYLGYYAASVGCCATGNGSGPGGTIADPQLVDGMHLAITSPCRGHGTNYSLMSAFDIDGDAWGTPVVSIGCDEVVLSAFVGPLSVSVQTPQTQLLVNRTLSLTSTITGRASSLAWSFGDGPLATNLSFLTTHAWTNSGDYTVTCTAYNNDNPLGVSGNLLVHVLPLSSPTLGSACLATNGFQFQLTGQTGAAYVLQMATNLTPPIVWQTLKTLNYTSGVVQVTDTGSTNAAQFYRILAQ